MERDEFFDGFLPEIESLPPEQRHERYLELFSDLLVVMTRPQITRFRAEVAKADPVRCCECGCEPNTGLLDLIDGHLALREIGAGEDLRCGPVE